MVCITGARPICPSCKSLDTYINTTIRYELVSGSAVVSLYVCKDCGFGDKEGEFGTLLADCRVSDLRRISERYLGGNILLVISNS